MANKPVYTIKHKLQNEKTKESVYTQFASVFPNGEYLSVSPGVRVNKGTKEKQNWQTLPLVAISYMDGETLKTLPIGRNVDGDNSGYINIYREEDKKRFETPANMDEESYGEF